MHPRTLDHYRTILLDAKRELVNELLELESDLDLLTSEQDIELMDNVQSEVPEQLLARLDERDRERLEAIEAALQRIETGTYGTCAACGQEIETRRLDALPAAEHCLRCQEAAETVGAVA